MQSNFLDTIVWPENPKKGTVTLRSYQKQALTKIADDYIHNRSRRQLIVLCVGLGKTLTAASIADFIFEHKRKPVLFLAHRDELLEQAAHEFKLLLGEDYIIETEQAEKTASLAAHVVMASVQTIGRSNSKRIEKFSKNHFGAILVDETHHVLADTYMRIVNYFMDSDAQPLLVGVTATPQRSKDEDLSSVFDSVAINMGIIPATKQGYCTPIVSYRVSSQTDLFSVRTTAGDFNIKDLADAVNNKERNTLIVETYLKRFPDKQALVFATDVDHIYRLEEEFNRCGVLAKGIDGTTDKEERRQAIRGFKSGKVKVLINFSITTEGFNYQDLDLIIQARPTQSSLLLNQLVGRNTRITPTKKVAHIVEIIDHHSSKTATVSKIFGFSQEFDCEGHDFLECMTLAETMSSQKEFFNPYNCLSYSDMLLKYNRATAENPKGFDTTRLNFQVGERKKKDDIYSEFNPSNEYYDSRYRYFYSGYNLKLIHTDKSEGYRYQVVAYPNALGGFDASIVKKPDGAPRNYPAEKVVSYRGASAPDAIKKAEEYLLENKPEWDFLLNVKAGWRKKAATEPCSEKQWNMVSGYKLSKLPREQISKELASTLISGFFSRK